MKSKLMIIVVLIFLSACSKEIELDQLQTRGNLVYQVNATSPFTGTVKGYFDNGQVRLKSIYKKGQKNGNHVEYFENGELKFNAKYKNGQLEGKYEEHYPNQILKKSGELVEGTGSEFYFTKSSKLYKTISYENHVVRFEKYEDVNYSYIEMISLSGLPYPEDEKLKSNYLSNLDNHAAKVFDNLVSTNSECFSGETVYYPSGKIMCTTNETTNLFYPNGNILFMRETLANGSFGEEVFSISGKSCGKQIFDGKVEGNQIIFYPDCSMYMEKRTSDSKIHLSVYHNQTPEKFLKSGHYYCRADGKIVYSGTDINCKKRNRIEADIYEIRNAMLKIENALRFYRLDNLSYPSNEEGLKVLLSKPAGATSWGESGSYIDFIPIDTWGIPYLYSSPGANGKEFDVYTLGADGIKGGDGNNKDWRNWDF